MPFTITDGTATITGTFNQTLTPEALGGALLPDSSGTNFYWYELATTFQLTGTTLTVTISGVVGSVVVADAVRVEQLTPLRAAEVAKEGAKGVELVEGTFDAVTAAAIHDWYQAGISLADVVKLQDTRIRVMDLPDGYLAAYVGRSVLLDRDADGHGWFIDSTPWEDSEFLTGKPGAGIDLLSTLQHEFGHALGFADVDPAQFPDSVMGLHLMPSQARRLAPGAVLLSSYEDWTQDSIPGQWRSVEVAVIDGVAVHVLEQENVTIHLSNGKIHRNPINPLDVSGDLIIAPTDARIIVNDLNRGGPRMTLEPTSASELPKYYYDTNGDGFITSFDVLAIINYLNSRLRDGEGEEAAEPVEQNESGQPAPRLEASLERSAQRNADGRESLKRSVNSFSAPPALSTVRTLQPAASSAMNQPARTERSDDWESYVEDVDQFFAELESGLGF